MADCFLMRKGGGNNILLEYIQADLILETKFNFVSKILLQNSISIGNNLTIEMCGKYTSIPSDTKKGRFFELSGNNGDIVAYSLYDSIFELKIGSVWYSNGVTNINLFKDVTYTITTVINNSVARVYLNNNLMATFSISSISHDLSTMYWLSGVTNDRTVIGNIYSLRIYNKTLTEEEITHNYTVDLQRYGD